MPIDKDKFAKHLRDKAETGSSSRCAKYVRKALEAGGATTTGHPVDAKDYEAVLLRNGYHSIPADSADTPYVPIKGDIAIIQPTSKGNKSGHIEGYDGKDWISDFVQKGFWPGATYKKERPSYAIYRP
jgi:hypothetical protein